MTAAELITLPVSERLRTVRTANGMTVDEVAAACNISAASVRAYEAGHRIPRDSVKIAIATMYRMDLPSLFF